MQGALDNLKEHCAALGPQYDTIEKTALCTVHLAGSDTVESVLKRIKGLADGISHTPSSTCRMCTRLHPSKPLPAGDHSGRRRTLNRLRAALGMCVGDSGFLLPPPFRGCTQKVMNGYHPPLARLRLLTSAHVRRAAAVLILLAVAAATLLPALRTHAQGTAPSPNAVLALSVAPGTPDRVLAGVLNSPQPAGIWRTTDGGLTWQNTTPGLAPNISIAALTYDPNNSRVAFAADGGSGFLYRSNDGGATWAEVPAVRALLSSNSAIGELLPPTRAAGWRSMPGPRFDGVLRSADAGATWQRLDGGLAGEARRIRELLTYDGALYAGTHLGLYRLPAGATTWEQVTGFPDTGIVYSLAVQGDTLLAGTDTALYQSADGDTWQRAPNAPTTTYYDIADTGRLLVLGTEAGLFVGSGESWRRAVDGVPYTGPVYALANTAQRRARSAPARWTTGCCAATMRG